MSLNIKLMKCTAHGVQYMLYFFINSFLTFTNANLIYDKLDHIFSPNIFDNTLQQLMDIFMVIDIVGYIHKFEEYCGSF